MTRVLCDAMLGKLATYLRMCGYDAAYALDRDVDDPEAVLTWARDEDRTLLTRNATLADRAPDAIHLAAHDPAAQLAELVDAGLDLALPAEPRRCSQCNGSVTRAGGDEPRPEYAPSTDEGPAWRCEACGQFYWRGSHWDDLAATLDAIDGE